MKGINFIGPLFRKVVSGEKTQTRRIMKEQPVSFEGLSGGAFIGRPIGEKGFIEPRYRAGGILYLKEPYIAVNDRVIYRYGNREYPKADKWQNKLFMPEKYARYYIRITDVRAERLQDISDEDCIREGIEPDGKTYGVLQDAYAALIDKIHGRGAWESNPFVWVYDFKLTSK